MKQSTTYLRTAQTEKPTPTNKPNPGLVRLLQPLARNHSGPYTYTPEPALVLYLHLCKIQLCDILTSTFCRHHLLKFYKQTVQNVKTKSNQMACRRGHKPRIPPPILDHRSRV